MYIGGKHKKYVECPIILISSGGDEYVPTTVDLINHTKRMQNLAILKGWTTNSFDENRIKSKCESYQNSSGYSLDVLKNLKLSNIFINEESAIEVAAIIPNAKHAIEEDIEQDQLMEVIQLLLNKLKDS